MFLIILLVGAVHLSNCVSNYPFDDSYNKQVRPNEGFVTDNIYIGIFVNRIRSISEMDMTMVLDVFLQGIWVDNRLNTTWRRLYERIYNHTPEECMTEHCNVTVFTLGTEFASKLWIPDFYISSAVSVEIADKVNDNTCIRFYRNMSIFYSNRIVIKISCIMSLVYFPFDRHTCQVCTGSYKYHDGLLKLIWLTDIAGMYPNQSTANFDIKSTTNQYPVEKLFMSDNFTEQCFEVFIQRKSNVFLVTLYLPSVSLVILTWVNFWIDPKAIPARSGLSITAILAQITLIVGMASRFPSVSDLKTADLYVTVNFIYTFGALIEFAIVSYVPRKTPNKNNLLVSPQISSSSLQNYQPGLYVSLNSNCDAPHSKDPKKFIQMNSIRQYPIRKNYNGICWRNHPFPKMRQVKEKKPKKYTGDDISKIIFPVSFTIWNILFFTVNLYLAET